VGFGGFRMTERYPTFPHLESIHKHPEIFDVEFVTVTEKIDGFNARFGRTEDGEFWVGSRNILAADSLQGFTEYAKSKADLIPNGLTLFGEWAGRGVQGRIDYGEKSFYLFDSYLNEWATKPETEYTVDLLECKTPQLLWSGEPPTMEQLTEMLSYRSDRLVEGVVLRAYPMLYDEYGHALIVKYKNKDFEEVKSKREDKPVADMTGAEAFVEEYVTEERLIHVKDQMKEQGLDPDAQNIGPLLRFMYNDIIREGADDFALLSEEQQKFVGKVCATVTRSLIV